MTCAEDRRPSRLGREAVTPLARRALTLRVREYRRRYAGGRRIRPHSDFFATNCPGEELRALIRRL